MTVHVRAFMRGRGHLVVQGWRVSGWLVADGSGYAESALLPIAGLAPSRSSRALASYEIPDKAISIWIQTGGIKVSIAHEASMSQYGLDPWTVSVDV